MPRWRRRHERLRRRPLGAEGGERAGGAQSRIVLVSQDFGPIAVFTERFPERHLDVGISEENLIGVAAGLAHAGKLPFVLGMAPFVSMRGFEQIRDDCAYNRNNVKFIAPFAGLEAGPWGATHHAIEDIALLRTIPGITILSPADPDESHARRRAPRRRSTARCTFASVS